MVRDRRLRLVVAIMTIFLPWALKRRVLCWLLGYELSASARIGWSVIAVSSCTVGEHAYIGHLTFCRGLARLELGDYARIGNLNWITGDEANPLPPVDPNSKTEMVLSVGRHSAITNRHYLDCLGGITVGEFTTVAGIRSQFLTHSIGLERCIQQVKPITIGDYCFIGTGCIVLQGAGLPDNCVLGAGSLLRTAFQKEWTLYAGVPARSHAAVPRSYNYFHRTTGVVD